MVYTLTLNPALDYVLKTGSLFYDDINRSQSEAIYYGGKGINVSFVLSRLGIDNKALGFLAGFTGKELEKMLKADGICCDFNYLASGNTRINVKLKADKEIDINANGPKISDCDLDALMKKLSALNSGDFLVLAGSVPNSLGYDTYEKIMKSLDEKEINFVVDATGKSLLNTLKYKPFLIKPNHIELGELFGKRLESEKEIAHFAKELQKMGAKNVLVSCAEKGATLLDEYGNIYKSENADGKLINSVGCGDSMVAGFLAGYINEQSYSKALMLGTACGNATAYSEALATKQDIESILTKINKPIKLDM